MYIYYVLIDNVLKYFETEEEMTETDFETYFEGFTDRKIEVYKNCCNYGPFDLIYKNY